jgi:pimeloyl-ACP methyl ester carboxylesterase
VLVDGIAYDFFPEPAVVVWPETPEAMLNAELEVLEEANHFLPEDAPDRLAQLIIRFVKTRL